MACDSRRFDEDAYLIRPEIVDPKITGGTITGSTLSNISITDNIQLDASVAEQIADQICEYVKQCVEFPAEDVAAVFADCFGNRHVPNNQIPTCGQMNAAITAAMNLPTASTTPATTESSATPTTIFGGSREVVLGTPTVWLELNGWLIPAYAPQGS